MLAVPKITDSNPSKPTGISNLHLQQNLTHAILEF